MKKSKDVQKRKLNKQDHKLLVFWAADCAEHVLPYFEKEYPKDDRPRKAIEAGRTWAHSDVPMVMKEIRSASLSSHAAARGTDNASARAAARSAGQAVAAVHVPEHAYAAAYYAIKAVKAQGIDPAKERDWQYRKIPKRLRPTVLKFLKRFPKLFNGSSK